ncbi:helix-turn-helix domain-containing protein [Conexibacter stalactiti]|uniref:Helix-turn-helix domain-containing protein n=1 Tax=Conexibacter stalactiti TaxID=1940611 RepID=A0ABU4HMM1_9ACTN|nr:helix-turn-helix domain-containing protein [Conexibacter stalactiti]MDW5594546.1 helix-turn-helix domain-containing protein [Conexibacter stalactiti]MEC5035188.1 helix-turn-helix domain-containing protein [Conexibacter stalactiti]
MATSARDPARARGPGAGTADAGAGGARGASGASAADASRRRYHHGDLREALVEATFELVQERGVHAFSVAEAARRTGVSAAAPYRHFADRGELLAEAATRAALELRGRFAAALTGDGGAADRIAAAAVAYVRFAAERRAMFEVLFGAGLEKSRYPRLEETTQGLLADLVAATLPLAPGRDPEAASALVLAMAGLAQGHATLMLDHAFGIDGEAGAVADAERRVAAATRALVRGRSVLFSELGPGAGAPDCA